MGHDGWGVALRLVSVIAIASAPDGRARAQDNGLSTEQSATSTTEHNGEPDRDTEDGETEDLQAGGELGYANLDQTNYVAPTLSADARLHFLQAAIRIPIRFSLVSGDVRKKDWDEVGDFFRVGQCIRLDWSEHGRFEREHGLCRPWQVERDDYYLTLRIGPQNDINVGHGTIVNSYSNNLNPDHFHPGVVAEWQFHQFVVGRFVMDNLVAPSLLAGTVAVRPFAYETEQTEESYESQHQFQLNATLVSDLRAPMLVRTAFGRALSDEAANLLYTTHPVTVIGGDFQYKYVFGTQVSIEAHADWNYITDHGMGLHGQLWFVYNHPDGDYSVRGEGEFRYIAQDYIPNYFDSYYAIQRAQFGLTPETAGEVSADGTFLTKQQVLDALPGGNWQGGYQLGLTFEAFAGEGDDRRSALRARFYLGDTLGRSNDGQFVLTLQVPRLAKKIDIYALYSRQNFDRLVDIFQLDNTVIKVLVRWDLNDQFYLLMNYGRLFQLSVDPTGSAAAGFQSGNDFNISLGFAEGL